MVNLNKHFQSWTCGRSAHPKKNIGHEQKLLGGVEGGKKNRVSSRNFVTRNYA